MKKRILSILLAALMIVPMICAMPITASAAVSNNYSYKFKDTDIRNYVEGQVVDLGYVGEAKVAPIMDGVINDGEYSIETSIKRHSNAKAHASLPMHIAVKDGYLYVAIEYAGETKRTSIQWDINVFSGHQSHQAYARLNPTQNSNGTISEMASNFMGLASSSTWAPNQTSVYSSNLLVDQAWQLGVYEVKFDLMYLYRVYGLSVQCENVWESPLVGLFFFYDVSNESTVGQSQYCYSLATSTKLDSERAVGWVPKTIIIPQTALDYICERSDEIGPLGFDARNAAETQLATIPSASTVAPVQNGVVSDGEYAVTEVHKQNIVTTYGDLTAHYAVKDGMIYAAFQYEETKPQNVIIQFGLSAASLPTAVCRTGYTIKPDGSFAKQNYLYKDSLNPNGWLPAYIGGAGATPGYTAMKSASYSNANGITTIEISASIPVLAASFEDTGWEADMTNAISFMLYPDLTSDNNGDGSADQLTMSFSTATQGTKGTLLNQIKYYTGLTYGVSCVEPTVQLPDNYIRTYSVDDVDDLEAFGQLHFNASPSAVVVDGKIGAGEYTTSHTYTELRSKDSIAVPDVTENVNGTNYFAYDEEYIYVGASVYEPNYKSNVSAYQFNISVLDKKDGKVDIGDGVTRINMMGKVYSDGTYNTPTYSGVYRSNNWVYKEGTTDLDYRVGESEFAAAYKAAYGPIFAGSYDADTKTLYYEFAIKIADLKTIFNVDEVESFNFMNYVVYGDAKTVGWTVYKTGNASGVIDALKIRTYIGNNGVLNYSNDHFLHVVHLDNKSQTRQSASIRLAAEEKNSGLRFKSHYTNEYLANMQAYAAANGQTMEIGTLIAPADYITGEFTHAALGAGNYVEVMASTATPYANANGVTTIAGSLVNIKEGNLARDFAGRGFIKIGNEYFYTDNYTVRNVSAIATDALADKSATQTDDYKYQLADGKFSPYAPGQITILEGLKSN